MAITISPRKILLDQEKKIIQNLIVDTDYCKQIIPLCTPETFDIPYCKKIFIWVKDYFLKYQSAPNKTIKDIFEVKGIKLQEEEKELVKDFLQLLSNEFEKEDNKNTKYLVDSAIPYIKSQSYIKLSEKIQANAKLGELEECSKLLTAHKNIVETTSGCINPNDPDFIQQTFKSKINDLLFEIPGPLNDLIKPERGRLVAFMAPPKAGKTWTLHTMGLFARMNKLKVFEANLEMSATKINYRDLKMISSRGDESKEYIFPVFDCKKNQFSTCIKKERINKITLVNDNGEVPEFHKRPKEYLPCVVCRGNQDFEVATWFESRYREKLTLNKALKMNKAFGLMYGNNNYRLKSYPKFAATANDIINDLDILEYSSGFIPDVLIIDYADILKPMNQYLENRHQLDETWKMLGRIATERNILVLTASQTNRIGAGKKNIKGTDIAEAFSKVAHVDTLIMIQQTSVEKRKGISRYSVGYNRDGDCDTTKQIIVLQNFALGQAFLDSEIMNGYVED